MFFDTIAAINKVVNDFVWGVPAMVCIMVRLMKVFFMLLYM